MSVMHVDSTQGAFMPEPTPAAVTAPAVVPVDRVFELFISPRTVEWLR